MSQLHPLSIPYRITQSILGYVPLIFFVAIASGPALGSGGIALWGFVTFVGIAGLVAWQIAYYRRFEYETTPDTFDIRSGVVSRRNREIPYRRVQNVDISRNVVQRAFEISELRIETAGGGETEAILRYVGYEEAKRLQNELRRRKRAESVEQDREEAKEDELYAITPEDLTVLAIASFDLRLASFLSVLLSIAGPPVLIQLLTDLPISPFLVLGAVIVLVVVGSALLSGVNAVLSTYGFRLTRSGDELRYERGLIQRFDGSIPLDKVQLLVFRENLLKRILGYSTLVVETAGYAPGQGSGAGSESAVPIARREKTRRIAREIEHEIAREIGDWVRVPTKIRGLNESIDRSAWQELLSEYDPIETFAFEYDLDLAERPVRETIASGTVLGTQGRILVLEREGTTYAVDMRDLIGYELREGETDRPLQSSLGAFG